MTTPPPPRYFTIKTNTCRHPSPPNRILKFKLQLNFVMFCTASKTLCALHSLKFAVKANLSAKVMSGPFASKFLTV